jgi:hypothetical protein
VVINGWELIKKDGESWSESLQKNWFWVPLGIHCRASKCDTYKSSLYITLCVISHQQHVSAIQAVFNAIMIVYIYMLQCHVIFSNMVVFRLKMAFVAETCCWWLIGNKFVYRLDLYLF